MKLGGKKVSVGNEQAQGSRPYQEDYFAVIPEEVESDQISGLTLVLADGMGGLIGGDAASVVAVKSFTRSVHQHRQTQPNDAAMFQAVQQANQDVIQAAQGQAIGTTLTALLLDTETFTWASVGDSVILLSRQGTMTRLNKDHNLGSQIDNDLKQGRISDTVARRKEPERHLLTSHLGIPELPQLEISQPEPWQPGDVFLLCSDGLTNALSLQEIHALVETHRQDPCGPLVREALTKQLPGQDNVSVVTASIGPFSNKKSSIGWLWIWLFLGILCGALGASFFWGGFWPSSLQATSIDAGNTERKHLTPDAPRHSSPEITKREPPRPPTKGTRKHRRSRRKRRRSRRRRRRSRRKRRRSRRKRRRSRRRRRRSRRRRRRSRRRRRRSRRRRRRAKPKTREGNKHKRLNKSNKKRK